MEYQLAQYKHYKAIATLHTLNWRQNYRGMVSDEYLDHEVEKDRLQIWNKRTSDSNANQQILLAFDQDQLAGFVCTFLQHKEGYPGAYLDNLHVHPNYQGKGIGAILMKKSAQWVAQDNPTNSLFLWVLAGNSSAINFYNRLRGQAEPPIEKELPWGERGKVIRYIWEDLTPLLNS